MTQSLSSASPPPPPQPTLRFANNDTVVPGDRLGTIRQVTSGIGTYVKGGTIYASLVGTVQLVPTSVLTKDDSQANTTTTTTTTTAHRPHYYQVLVLPKQGTLASFRVLRVGDVVVGRIRRITNREALVDVLAFSHSVNNNNGNDSKRRGLSSDTTPLLIQCEGTIRKEDVRQGASEEIRMQDYFRPPNDWVLCRVLSLGDASRGGGGGKYVLLTTADPDLGVICATSASSGQPMMVQSWNEMKCPLTGTKEFRKCAKPRLLHNDNL